jgi:cytochrome P450
MVAAVKVVPDGPRGERLLGNMAEFNRDPLAFIERCAREYGDVVLVRFLYVPAYFISHPEQIEWVLSSGNKNFVKTVVQKSPLFLRLVGNGLVTSEGEFWRRQRRLSQPAFHRQRTAAYGAQMVAQTERLISGWRDGEMRDVHEEMTRLTQSIVVSTLFSSDVSDEADEIAEALSVIVEPFTRQATLKWVLDNRLPTPARLRFERAARRIDRVVYRLISERRASGADTGDLLSMLLRAQDEDGTHMTDRQLRDEVMTLFLAGHETTALALTWAWYLLGLSPEVEARLHAELDAALGSRAATAADLPRLRYAEWVIKEAMRLFPPVYGLGREAVEDCDVGGYYVPRGMQVFMFPWVVHRDPRWYDEPEHFRPERWHEDEVARRPRFAYFPFGGGPRVCIGNAFAMMEATLVLATIARRFRLRPVPEHRIELLPAMSLRPRDGVRVTLEER